jgi:hypothetical protein
MNQELKIELLVPSTAVDAFGLNMELLDAEEDE